MNDAGTGIADPQPSDPSSDFWESYKAFVSACSGNDYSDNYDYRRFGNAESVRRRVPVRRMIGAALRMRLRALARQIRTAIDPTRAAFDLARPHLAEWRWLYATLGDMHSRDLLIRLLAYRSLGHRKVKLPLSRPEYWHAIERLEQRKNEEDTIQTGFNDWKLAKFEIDGNEGPIELYASPAGVFTQFVEQQYLGKVPDREIGVSPGDVVIDAGGCYGDTALYFADRVGPTGRVFSCEFMEQNLRIFRENMRLNSRLRDRVVLVENPLWATSGKELYISGSGPATRVSESAVGSEAMVSTLSIDDLVDRYGVERVDFIKMDIEGAEVEALKGAADTIRRFKPRLAICLYHRLSDFWMIPRFLSDLNCGYEFYIRHFTIHQEETVLFARARGDAVGMGPAGAATGD